MRIVGRIVVVCIASLVLCSISDEPAFAQTQESDDPYDLFDQNLREVSSRSRRLSDTVVSARDRLTELGTILAADPDELYHAMDEQFRSISTEVRGVLLSLDETSPLNDNLMRVREQVSALRVRLARRPTENADLIESLERDIERIALIQERIREGRVAADQRLGEIEALRIRLSDELLVNKINEVLTSVERDVLGDLDHLVQSLDELAQMGLEEPETVSE
ncbi:MAG: hypothetical protein H6842_11130 [Rhodospirillaceae bacterium]|nr:hypothetical protein [Rhodospirillaceae bacterium]